MGLIITKHERSTYFPRFPPWAVDAWYSLRPSSLEGCLKNIVLLGRESSLFLTE